MQLIVCILSQNIGFYVGYDTPGPWGNLTGFRQILAVTLACWYSFTWHRGYNSPAGDTWQYVTRVVTLGSAWRFSRTINSSVRLAHHSSGCVLGFIFSLLGSVVTLCSLFLPLLARYIQIWIQAEIFVKVSQPQSLEVVFIRGPGGKTWIIG